MANNVASNTVTITQRDLENALLRWQAMHEDGNTPTFEGLREQGYDAVGAVQILGEVFFGVIWEMNL